MNRNSGIIAIGSLIIGFLVGASSLGTASAEESATSTTAPQGDLLKVCIDKKTGAIRASGSCKSTERAYVLGGPGPKGVQGVKGDTGATGVQGIQGIKGDTGPSGIQGIQGVQGIQGDRGFTGATGATGSVSGLRTQSINFLNGGSFSGCPGTFLGASATVVESIYSSSISGRITASTKTLQGCYLQVYTP